MVENLKNELDQQEYKNRKLVRDLVSHPEPEPSRRRSDYSPPESPRHRDRPSSSSRRQPPSGSAVDDVASNFLQMKLSDPSTSLKYGRKRRDSDDDDVQTDESSQKIVNSFAQSYLAQAGGNVSESELRRRAEFMAKQRELLAEKKRAERQKQLDQFSTDRSSAAVHFICQATRDTANKRWYGWQEKKCF